MKSFIITILVLLSFNSSFAQDCNCCSEDQKAFDFWVGDWVVFDTSNQQIGENTITKLESGCILNERWKGGTGSNGSSYNYFNKKDSTWNQLWIDNRGNNLKLKGKAVKHKMTLRSELKKGKKGQYYDQITWTKVSDNEVIQLWETFRADNSRIAELFKGIYRRK